ncbi:hypothetical protein CPC08DRAFT_752400 [Agrocybe pediades]|nr:hypothetical protein CPC08DRAFT_752400 [Agrocybe pediades]
MGLNTLAFALRRRGEESGDAGRDAVNCDWATNAEDVTEWDKTGDDEGECSDIVGFLNRLAKGEVRAEMVECLDVVESTHRFILKPVYPQQAFQLVFSLCISALAVQRWVTVILTRKGAGQRGWSISSTPIDLRPGGWRVVGNEGSSVRTVRQGVRGVGA